MFFYKVGFSKQDQQFEMEGVISLLFFINEPSMIWNLHDGFA